MTRQTPIYLTFCLVFITAISCIAQESVADCSMMQQGVFTQDLQGDPVKVVIKGNRCMAFRDNGKYVVKSKMDWINDCEYKLTLMQVTVPDYPYFVGQAMNVKIDKVEGDKVYYTARMAGEAEGWPGMFTKLEGQ